MGHPCDDEREPSPAELVKQYRRRRRKALLLRALGRKVDVPPKPRL